MSISISTKNIADSIKLILENEDSTTPELIKTLITNIVKAATKSLSSKTLTKINAEHAKKLAESNAEHYKKIAALQEQITNNQNKHIEVVTKVAKKLVQLHPSNNQSYATTIYHRNIT